jgi:hypothetical protein
MAREYYQQHPDNRSLLLALFFADVCLAFSSAAQGLYAVVSVMHALK